MLSRRLCDKKEPSTLELQSTNGVKAMPSPESRVVFARWIGKLLETEVQELHKNSIKV